MASDASILDLPLVTDADLQTLPEGLYLVAGPDGTPQRFDQRYSINRDDASGHDLYLLARVRQPKDTPGVLSVELRPDGLQIVKQYGGFGTPPEPAA
jgi:hypothetical protein